MDMDDPFQSVPRVELQPPQSSVDMDEQYSVDIDEQSSPDAPSATAIESKVARGFDEVIQDMNKFITYANDLSREILTRVSSSDITMMKGILKEYKNPGYFVGYLQTAIGSTEPSEISQNAYHLYVVLTTQNIPFEAVERAMSINSLILVLFISDNDEQKKQMLAYLRSLNNSKVNSFLDEHFSST